MFTDFDFSALDDPTFKEDAVREEIIAPILRRAGYTPTGSMRVQRSKPLTHPFVMIGSKKHPVSVIPDYTLFHDDRALMILDAKKPSEEIVNSIHVEQAYSYAIHPEVRCQIYGLCNGRHLSFFNIGRSEGSGRHVLSPVLSTHDGRILNLQTRVRSPVALPNLYICIVYNMLACFSETIY